MLHPGANRSSVGRRPEETARRSGAAPHVAPRCGGALHAVAARHSHTFDDLVNPHAKTIATLSGAVLAGEGAEVEGEATRWRWPTWPLTEPGRHPSATPSLG